MEFWMEGGIPEVELHPASGRHPTKDHWVALLPELGLQHVDLGIDAALMGLAECASEAVSDRLESEDFDSNNLQLLLRLRSARQTGTLGELFRSSARLHGWGREGTAACGNPP
jgi:hypothetical protein